MSNLSRIARSREVKRRAQEMKADINEAALAYLEQAPISAQIIRNVLGTWGARAWWAK